ncbi:hypothetical protein V1522DRAFT_410860 [Lipomyces starkeyi]
MNQIPVVAGLKRKACVNCTTAKAKCSPYNQQLCERCQRLGKECVYLGASNSKRKPKDAMRVQNLEGKVQALEARLATLTKQMPPSSLLSQDSPECPFTPTTHIQGAVTPVSDPSSVARPYPILSSRANDTGSSPNGMGEGYDLDIIDRGLLSLGDVNKLLDVFRNSLVDHFPFVVLPPSATAESLRRQSPFLFLAIIASMAFENSPLQRHLGNEIKKQIASRIILGTEKNMDLLQGLLVHMAWYHYFVRLQKQQMFLILQLCITLVQDLGLHRSPKDNKHSFCLDQRRTSQTTRNPAEKRALLGVYYLSATYATASRKQSIMNYSKYMEECCQSLTEDNEFPSDRWIKPFIRLQVLARRISDGFCYDDTGDSELHGEAAVKMATDGFRHELDHLKAASSYEVTENSALCLDFLFLDVWIHEVALHDEFWPIPSQYVSTGPISQSPSRGRSFSFSRTNMLWHNLVTTKMYLETFLSTPTSHLFHLLFSSWSKLCYILVVQAKIVFFGSEWSSDNEHRRNHQSSGNNLEMTFWDTNLANKEAEMPQLCALLQDQIASITSNLVSAEGDRDVMYQLGFLIKRMMAGYERRMKRIHMPNIEDTRNQPAAGSQNAATSTFSISATAQVESGKEGTNSVEGGSGFGAPPELSQELFEDFIWGTMLDDFTMMPTV